MEYDELIDRLESVKYAYDKEKSINNLINDLLIEYYREDKRLFINDLKDLGYVIDLESDTDPDNIRDDILNLMENDNSLEEAAELYVSENDDVWHKDNPPPHKYFEQTLVYVFPDNTSFYKVFIPKRNPAIPVIMTFASIPKDVRDLVAEGKHAFNVDVNLRVEDNHQLIFKNWESLYVAGRA